VLPLFPLPTAPLSPYTTLFRSIPLVLLTLVDPRASAPVAWITAVLLVALYAALVTARGVVADRKRRLRLMAILMLAMAGVALIRSEEHTSELQSREKLVCRLLL